MRLRELIADLQDDLEQYGDMDVRAETYHNNPIDGTLRAHYNGATTLFLMLGPGEEL